MLTLTSQQKGYTFGYTHAQRNRDQDRDKEKIGCGSFHITPELGQEPRPIVPHSSDPSYLGPGYV